VKAILIFTMKHILVFLLLSISYLLNAQTPTWVSSPGCQETEPSLQQILINACGIEIYNEFIIFSTGTSSYNPNNLVVSGSNAIPSVPPSPAPTASGFSGTAPNVSIIVNQLNAWAGCGIVFKAAPNPIPEKSLVMAFNSTANIGLGLTPSTPHSLPPNLSSYCGKEVYVVAATVLNPTPGGTEGIFDNQQGVPYQINVNFGACSTTVGYGIGFSDVNGAYLTCDIINAGKSQFNAPVDCFPPACNIPDVTATIATGTACISSNSDISLDALINNAPGAQYQWMGQGANNFSSSIRNPVIVNNGLAPGTYTYTLKVATTGGCYKKSSVNVTIGPPLNFTVVPGDITVCGATPLPYAVTGTPPPSAGATYRWSTTTPSATIFPSSTAANVTITTPVSGSLLSPITIGNYSVTVTETNGCSWVKAFKITTLPPPLVANVVNPINICDGQPINLTVTSGSFVPPFPTTPLPFLPFPVEFKWTGLNSFVGTQTTSSTPNTVTVPNAQYPGVGTHVYSLVASIPSLSTHSSCFSVPANVTVNVSAAGTINLTSAQVCSGGSVNLSSLIASPLPAPSGTWAGLNVSGTTFSAGSLASGNYNVTFTPASSACLGAANTTISVNAKPTISPSQSGRLCGSSMPYEGTVTLNVANGFSNYQWSAGVTGTGASVTVTTPGNYTVTVTNNEGCTELTTFSVLSNPKPTPTIIAPSVLCSGGSAKLYLGNAYSTFLWNDNSSDTLLNITGPGTYSVTVTDANGCSAVDSKTVNLGASLTPALLPYGKICGSGNLTLGLTSNYTNYLWSNNSMSPTLTVSTGGIYSVTVTNSATGCTGSVSGTVQQFVAPDITIDGNTNICPNAATVLNAIPATYNSYQWSNGASLTDITVSIPTTYTLTATDANGCSVVKSVVLTNSAAPTPIINGANTVCSGQTTTLNLSGGVFSSIIWSDGSSNNSITVTKGNYTVTVTNSNGCSATNNKTITEDVVNVSIIGNTNVCPNQQITLGTSSIFNSYNWSNGANTQTIAVAAGNYSVTVTNSNSCTAEASIVVNAVSSPTVTITANDTYCQGTLNPISTTTNFNSYLWSNGQAAPSINAVGTGTYSVTVSDVNGCTAVASKSIVENQSPIPNISGALSICSGASTTLEAQNGFATYLWNNGVTTNTITTSQTGLYSLSVSDINGCIGVTAVNIISSGSINFNIIGKNIICEGETTTLNAGAGFSSYLWSTGESSQTISVNTANNYAVTVNNGACNGIANITVVKNVIPNFSILGKNSICEGQLSALTPSQSFASYRWSNGTLNAVLQTAQSGNYSVTVTDANGCTAFQTTSLSVNPNPKPVIAGKSSICLGDSTLLSVNQSFAGFLWSNGQTQNAINVKAVNLYTVTVTDSNGCTGIAATNVSQVPNLKPTITSRQLFCEGDTLHILANQGFQKYLWSNGQTTDKIIVQQGGKYSVTVSDGACSGTDSINVTMNLLPDITISMDTAICEGIEVALKANAGNNIYKWSNGINTPFNNVKLAGKYIVTVTTSAGCSDSAAVSVIVHPNPKPLIVGQNTICFGERLSLKLDAPYAAYRWSNNSTFDTLSVSQSGIYRVTVTSDKGCTAEASKQIEIKNNLTPQIIGKTTICEIGGEVTLQLDATYPTTLWSTFENTPSIVATTAGTYGVTVSTASGCSGTASFTISAAQNPIPILEGDLIICGSKPAILDAGIGYIKYLWSNGASTQKIQVNNIGDYSVTVTNSEGCTGDTGTSINFAKAEGFYKDSLCQSEFKILNGKRYDLTNPKGTEVLIGAATGGCDSILNIELFFKPEISVSFVGTNQTCKANQTIEVTLNVIGYSGAFDLTYRENNSNEKIINGVKNGDKIALTPTATSTYTITNVSISSGFCPPKLSSFTIAITPLGLTKKVDKITCANVSNGAISLSVAGTSPYRYLWNNGMTTADLRDLKAGTYAVTVIDAQNCQIQDSVLLISPDSIKLNSFGQGKCNSNKGEIIIQSISGGSGNFIYSLNNQPFESIGSQPFKIPNLNIGQYQLTVAEANDKNCSSSEVININATDSIKIELGNDITLSFGDSIVLTPTSTFQMERLKWTPVITLSCDTCQFVVVKPKTTTRYYVSVWDENGCIAQDDINVIITKNRKVFIPTVFSPDANGTNDLFRVFLGDEVVKVHFFRIFDRWGNIVYQDLDFSKADAQDTKRGWDGTYRGAFLPQSVFTYHVKIEFTDGEIKDYVGDVMLLGR
jgi:gliding motility-associated-like protein